jgi:hypothetical protein
VRAEEANLSESDARRRGDAGRPTRRGRELVGAGDAGEQT